MQKHLNSMVSRISRNFRWDITGIAMYIPGYGKKLFERAAFTEVGAIHGHVSVIDEGHAMRKGLQKLNRFEKWLMEPRIEVQKSINWNRYRQAVIDFTGEDLAVDPIAGLDDECDDAFVQVANAIVIERFAYAISRI